MGKGGRGHGLSRRAPVAHCPDRVRAFIVAFIDQTSTSTRTGEPFKTLPYPDNNETLIRIDKDAKR